MRAHEGVSSVAEASAPVETERVPVEAGFWIIILGDLSFFAAMFIAFVLGRHEDAASYALYTESAKSLHTGSGLLNTIVLLSSSYLVARAVVMLRDGDEQRGRQNLMMGAALGAVFIALKVIEYARLLGDGYGVTSSDFHAYYFTFTGVHLLHVVIGVLLMGYLIHASRPERAAGERPALIFHEGVAIYWHMVDMLWLFLFSLFYLIA